LLPWPGFEQGTSRLPLAVFPSLQKAKPVVFFCFYGEGPRSSFCGRNAALSLILQLCDEDDWCFLFFREMEHRWNEIDRGKPKYSGKNLSQCHFVHHKSHMD
jgi:hypothetical protein